jgi:hypothetical protein
VLLSTEQMFCLTKNATGSQVLALWRVAANVSRRYSLNASVVTAAVWFGGTFGKLVPKLADSSVYMEIFAGALYYFKSKR